jgi:argininosuccinate lyase
VHAAVEAVGEYDRERMLAAIQRLAQEVLGHPLQTSPDTLRQALDAEHFVAIRNIPGGPAPEAVSGEIQKMRAEQTQMNDWISVKTQQQLAYPKSIERAKASILSPQASL